MVKKKCVITSLLMLIFIFSAINTHATTTDEFKRLQLAYPACIQDISAIYIAWKDGTRMPIKGSIPIIGWLVGLFYHLDNSVGGISREDVLRDRYEPLFRKMYGNSANEVKRNLVTIYWMPKVFGTSYPLKVTTVNGVAEKLRRISAKLEKLPPSYYKYLANPAGTFYWRKVAGEPYMSSHSFGIAIDINSSYSNYWLWDYQRLKLPMSDLPYHTLTHHNRVPLRIVEIFEKEGFLWGGRWYYYDTMHFEYRPEFFVS
jgi:peptidoglycan LD-endopeptidase CwlK